MDEDKKYHSKIRKTISRKIQTDNFESVDVYVSSEEWIEWDTDKERVSKTSKQTQVLLDDFKDAFNRTVSALGADRLIGTGETRDGRVAKVKETLEEEKDVSTEDIVTEKSGEEKSAEEKAKELDAFDIL
jgi:hypothetical protein